MDSRIRAVEGVLQHAFCLPKTDPLIIAAKAAGVTYFESKSKKKGPPHHFIYKAFVKAFAMTRPAKDQLQLACYRHLQSLDDLEMLASTVRYFTVRDQKHTDKATVLVHLSAQISALWEQIFAELRTRTGFEMYPGAPPRGPLVRALKDYLS